MAILKFTTFYLFERTKNMADVSFTSRIRPVSCKDFNKIVSVIPRNKFVSHPWLIEDSKMGQNVFTTNICDCTSCLISNGQEALLMHLSPMQESNHFFNNVLIYLRNHLDLKDENLQAILVGSKNTKKSLDIYNKFVDLLNNFGIPISELKNGKTPTNVAYKTNTDEIYVSNLTIDKLLKKGNSAEDALDKSFEKIEISKTDSL